VAYVIDPRLFETRRMRVDVECASPLSAGQTVCDVWAQRAGVAANVTVALSMDTGGFWDLMLAALARADGASPLNACRDAGV
jgi:inosine-uridine nucleoside N-ribohydrolase